MRAVIFDFDGTIADSFSAVMDIAYRLTNKEQLADINNVQAMRNNHTGLREAIKMLDLPRWRVPWLLKKGRSIMAKDINGVPLFEGMNETLSRLASAKYELFIVTSNSTHNVERFLTIRGILPYFKGVYGGAGLFKKQSLIKRVLRLNALNPSDTIYVGDEVRDIEAAKSLNMPIIAVSWGYNTEQLLLQHSPTVLARTPKQLADVIIGWDSTP